VTLRRPPTHRRFDMYETGQVALLKAIHSAPGEKRMPITASDHRTERPVTLALPGPEGESTSKPV